VSLGRAEAQATGDSVDVTVHRISTTKKTKESILSSMRSLRLTSG